MHRAPILFTFQDIPVKVHWSFLLVLIVIGLEIYHQSLGLSEALWLIFLFFWVFVFVIMHEFGHALTARRYRIRTFDIVLLPIGGLARLMRMPTRPREELVIALAGPLVNLTIAIIIGLILLIARHPWPWIIPAEYHLHSTTILPTLVVLNLTLFFFNLIPALPMDGGRVLRAGLSFLMSRSRATLVAVILGKIIAVGLALFGLYYQEWTVMLIGIFVFYHSGREYRQVLKEERWRQTSLAILLNSVPANGSELTSLEDANELVYMDASASVFQAWEHLREHPAAHILVFQRHIPIGILNYDRLIRNL